jgi:hypothetical protein
MNNLELLVEATINGVFTDPVRKEVRIQLTSAWDPRERMQFLASGVDDFFASEMRLSNVVEGVTLHDAAGIDTDSAKVAQRLFLMMRGRQPEEGELEWDILLGKMERIRHGEFVLLDIESLYGADLLILASKIVLQRHANFV